MSAPVHPRSLAQVQECPSCSDPHVHLGEVTTWPGTPDYPRGSTIEILMWCECGQIFTVSYSFHKGRTYYYEKRRAQVAPEDTDECVEMWRD